MSTASTGPAPFSDSFSNTLGSQASQPDGSFDQTLQEENGLVVVNGVLNLLMTWLNTPVTPQTLLHRLEQSGVEFYQHVDTSIRVSLKQTHQLPIEIAFYNNPHHLGITVTVSAELFSAFSNSRLELEKKLKKSLGKSVQLDLKKL